MTFTHMSAGSSEKTGELAGPLHPNEEQFQKLIQVISRSQHNYRELIDSLDHAIFTLSLTGEIRVANRGLAEILDVSFQDLIGHRIDEFVAQPGPAEAKRPLAALLERGSWSGMLPVHLKKDRELRYFDCWFQTVSEEGQVAFITGWARDVTTQHDSEMRFAELFEYLREGIFITTPEGKLLDANPALVQMLGYGTKEELQSYNFRDLYAQPSQRDEIVRELGQKGSIQNREIVFRGKDGKEIHCLSSGFATRDAFGQLVRLQGTLVDITDRLEMEKRLHQEEEFVRRLVASFPDVIVVVDRDGRHTFASDRVQEVLGSPPEGFVGEEFGGRAHPEDRSKLVEMFQNVINGKAALAQVEYRTRHADGNWRTLRSSAGPLFDASGEITGIVASARDVTESKEIERQLAQKEKFSEMGQMMAGAAHELNNPLTAILGVADLLRERTAEGDTRRQVDIILQQARRAAIIVQNLLAFSRPLALGRGRIHVGELIQQALQLQQASLQQKNIEVQFTVPKDLPAIAGDARQLTQAFSNFIMNAEQAISAVRDHGILKITLARINGKVSVTFSDDGAGISPENFGKIFDPFFTTKRPGGGTGLGLTICVAVVKDHGGSIDVQSSPGSGASFRLLLPAAVDDLSEASQSAALADGGSTALRGRSALIVDDEESIREIVEESLTSRGMIVEGAASSGEALTLLGANSYDIVLCDLNLPGMTGEQLFDKLRAHAGNSTPRFVFMTGDLLGPSVVAAYRERGASVLQKPFHVSALAKHLAELLQPQPAKAN
jgi:PAS domain S-box-containing protein